jgi:selenide,water dikinase
MDVINNNVQNFKLLEGYSAETSGGILTMLEKSKVKDFINEHKEKYGQDVWIVGEVVKGSRKAVLRTDAKVINVKDTFLHM